MIYHKFSHDAAFYKLNGKNVNFMLEYHINAQQSIMYHIFIGLFPVHKGHLNRFKMQYFKVNEFTVTGMNLLPGGTTLPLILLPSFSM